MHANKVYIKPNLDSYSNSAEEYNDMRLNWCQNNLLSYLHESFTCKIKDNKLIIYGNIIICSDFGELPYKIDEVYGDVITDNIIDKTNGNLKSLKNFPTIIHGKLNISLNPKLTSLEGGPEIVEGSYWCTNCNLENLNGIAKCVKGHLIAYHNKINNVDDLLNTTINETVDITFNPIVIRDVKSLYKMHTFKLL